MNSPRTTRDTYHHGNLKAALIEATLVLIDEQGPDLVTVAAAAQRAGVSSGAPFRHFASKIELMTAVAEELQSELLGRMEQAYGDGSAAPWETLEDLGLAYLGWGLEQPKRFRTYSNRTFYAFEASPVLQEGDDRLTWLVESTYFRLLPQDDNRSIQARRLNIRSRALLTGLITLYCNGHFPRFGVPNEDARDSLRDSWRGYLAGLRLSWPPVVANRISVV
jgi:AcrR family transcriptional regulator